MSTTRCRKRGVLPHRLCAVASLTALRSLSLPPSYALQEVASAVQDFASMADLARSNSHTSSVNFSAPKISVEDGSTAGSDGAAARSRASVNAPISPARESQPEIVEEERLPGGPDEASQSRASANAPISPLASKPPQSVNDENEVVSFDPHQANKPPVNGPRQSTRKETFFGIPRPGASGPANYYPNYDDDYETRFPPDPKYQEVSDNARVFRVYMEEAAKYDALMTDEAREGLDVNLVFAGLFSAVLTTFVAQTSQSLQPDRATESTLLLREIAALQRAQMNGTSADSVPSTSADFTPSAIDVWVNGLWFTSLTLSLASALFAVLIKQWIRYYMSYTSGTVRYRSLIHQFRLTGLQKWHVLTLISILPVLMHLSLAIFFVGLTLFLLPLHHSIASIVGSASAFIFLAYIGTAVWPLFRVQCPYHSPLTNILYGLLVHFRMLWDLRMLWDRRMDAAMDDVVPVFKWLFEISSNPSVHCVVTQALGGCFNRSPAMTKMLSQQSLFEYIWKDMLAECICRSDDKTFIRPEKIDLLEQLFRSALHAESWSLRADSLTLETVQSCPAPTLQWEAVATAFLWHLRIPQKGSNFEDAALAQKACLMVDRLMLESRDKNTRLPLIVWEDLVAAASSCQSIPPLDRVHNLDSALSICLCGAHVSSRFLEYSFRIQDGSYYPGSFESVVRTNNNLVWSLLLPFDKHKQKALDSQKVQGILSLVNVFVVYGPSGVSRNVFFGAWKELICEVQAGSISNQDKHAICVAVNAFLQDKIAFKAMFGPNAVLLPSLVFLYCCPGTTTSRSAQIDVFLSLIEIDMFKVLDEFESIGHWLWSVDYDGPNSISGFGNFTAPIASLIASLIRTSFESQSVGSVSCPADSQWLDYLALPENSSAIVSMLTFQGGRWTPASVAQVRSDLVLFFDSRLWDCKILQNCRVSLEWYLKHFVPDSLQYAYKANVEEARRIIDGLISKIEQPSKPARNQLSRLLRRSRQSADAEAR